MILKKIFGFVFIVLAILLTLAAIALLPPVLKVFFMPGKIFNRDPYQLGEAIGQTFYWIVHIAATIALWRYGIRWIAKQREA